MTRVVHEAQKPGITCILSLISVLKAETVEGVPTTNLLTKVRITGSMFGIGDNEAVEAPPLASMRISSSTS